MIEYDLTEKIVYLSTQVKKENAWYEKYNSRVKKPQSYQPKEMKRNEECRDNCEHSLRENLNRLQSVLSIAIQQFNEQTKEP